MAIKNRDCQASLTRQVIDYLLELLCFLKRGTNYEVGDPEMRKVWIVAIAMILFITPRSAAADTTAYLPDARETAVLDLGQLAQSPTWGDYAKETHPELYRKVSQIYPSQMRLDAEFRTEAAEKWWLAAEAHRGHEPQRWGVVARHPEYGHGQQTGAAAEIPLSDEVALVADRVRHPGLVEPEYFPAAVWRPKNWIVSFGYHLAEDEHVRQWTLDLSRRF